MNSRTTLATVLLALCPCGLRAGAEDGTSSSAIVFRDVTEQAGLIAPLAGIMGHGGAMGDFDGDGALDLFVGGFCDRPNGEYQPAPGPVAARLLRNVGGGRFESAGQPAVEFFARTSGAVFADLDNNGTLELYVANNAYAESRRTEEPQRGAQLLHSRLFRNDAGKLVDISAESGGCPESLLTARNVGVFDYNGDGLLDLLVVEDKFRRGGGSRSVLFKNLGGLRFEDANRSAGLPDDIMGLGLAVADLNGDGRPDFFVPHSNRLFLSQANATWREATELRAVFAYAPLDGEDWPCGAAFGDLNRDGLLDLVVSTHHQPARNRLFLNDGLRDGVPQFREVTREAGLGEPVPNKCPHVEIRDFDNDGWPDIYMSAAWVDEGGAVTPLDWRNTGVSEGVPRFVPPRPIKEAMVYFPAGPSGDYDNDGRLDLFLVNWFAGNHSRLLHNESAPRNHWLDVRVTGKRMNRMGIGAQVRIYRAGKMGDAASLLGFQEISTGYGYASGQPALAHFGLGAEPRVDVLVTLPDRTEIKHPDAPGDRVLIVEEK
ncbi:MAG: enediyne biosynthesis protein [Chthoniobacter sp.]|nr:enediyne biosynthesis protein [Chthoniobacter sp.]